MNMGAKSEGSGNMHRCRLLIWIATAVLFMAVMRYNIRADDASLGAVGYGVVPLQNDQVTMAAERVEAEIRGDQAWVTCIFTFTNTGDATQLLIGFPQAQPTEGGAPELLDFQAFVDGEEMPVTFHPNVQPEGEWDYAGWHTFTVPFAAGQTCTIRNTYHGRLTWLSNGGRFFEYILHTGAVWQGPIGQADIIVHWQRDREVAPGTLSGSPPGYLLGQRELHWHFTNLEPTVEDDIRVLFRPIYGPHSLGTATASSGQVQPARTGYSLPAALFADGDPATAWRAEGETVGAWAIWSYHSYPHYASPTLGLGILPGMAGDEDAFRAHGRPKEVLVRVARLKEDVSVHWGDAVDALPVVAPIPDSFSHPVPQLEITEHRLTLEDAPRWQFLRFEKPATALAFQVVVESVYPGERYNDVAIAKVLFPLLEEDLPSMPAQLPATGGETVGVLAENTPLWVGWKVAPRAVGITAALLLPVIILRVRRRNRSRQQQDSETLSRRKE